MSKNKQHTILKVKNLAVGYATKKSTHTVQKDINLTFEKGQLVAVLGKNGIGKSTFLRTITRVQKPLKGAVELDVKDLVDYTVKDLAKKISLVLTESLPESQLTVFELVALGRQPYTNWIGNLRQEDIDKILWALEQTDAKELAEKHFYELSDGQLQRVLIARALAQDTEIIILDEPTAHLDMHHTIKIFQLLEKLVKKTQKTIIITSHQVNLAIKAADKIVLLTDGKVLSGTKEELVSTNAFDQLFESELISFNASLEQFVISKEP